MKAGNQLTEHIKKLEEKLLPQNNGNNAEDIASYISDDFIEFGSSGKIYNKRQTVEVLAEKSNVRIKIYDFNALLLSEDVLLATYTAEKDNASKAVVPKSLRSSIWKKEEGRWKIVFHQGTLLK